MSPRFDQLLGATVSATERRLLLEYGSVFVTKAIPPPVIIFPNANEVERFQSSAPITKAKIGSHQIELQVSAMQALEAAVGDALSAGLAITPRSADSGRRSYEDTVKLWLRNVNRGIEHWIETGRMLADEATAIQRLSAVEQIGVILKIEEERGLYFSTYFDKSILQSVAAPGASQHLSMLAFDVAEYDNPRVVVLMEQHGWFQTVVSDLPHFTFLGYQEEQLAALGLKKVKHNYGGRDYFFWTPDLA